MFRKFKSWLSVLCLVFLLQGCAPLTLPEPNIALSSKIYDQHGKLITSIYEENRIQVPLEQISKYAQEGIIAVEDTRFYQHLGIDPIGIGRALIKDIKAGKIVEGGSTISQQTAKNLYLTNERTFSRKFKEIYLTLLLERKYTKDEILAMYLNQIYFGYRAYGIEAAAQTYFAKSAKDLDLAESSMLVGIPARPNTYSPFSDWDAAKGRQAIVLQRMVDAKFITAEQATAAKKEKLQLASSKKIKIEKAPFFVEEVRKYIIDHYENGSELLLKGGLSIYTTLDLAMQTAAEGAIKQHLAQRKGLEGALVAINPQNGYVEAMVGGKDFAASKYNRVVAKRQPGSAFKPFLYSKALADGFTEASLMKCSPVSFRQPDGSDYTPQDYGSQPYHNRDFTLKEAIMISDNVVAVKLNEAVGPQNLVEYAQKFGFTSQLRPYLSLALGTSEVSPMEMSSAYGAFANQGMLAKPMIVTKIVTADQNVLEENKPQLRQIISPQNAYIISDMLRGVVQSGTAKVVGRTLQGAVAGKTGTTQNYQDAWFVGFTPAVSAAVWVGYDQPRSTGQTGGGIAAPIWTDFLRKAAKNPLPQDFSQPIDIIKKDICTDTGLLATPFSPKVLEMAFIKGTEPTEECYVHSVPSFPMPGLPLPGEPPQQPPNQAPGEGANPPFNSGQDALEWGKRFWQQRIRPYYQR